MATEQFVPEGRWRPLTRSAVRDADGQDDTKMLMTVVIILLALWLLGMVTSYTIGGMIHILLVVAVVVVLVRLIQGRRVV